MNRAEASLESSQEKRDVPSLEEEIRSKEMRLNGLGIFKGKEKKELQSQIYTLSSNLNEANRKVDEKLREIGRLKEAADKETRKVTEFETTVISGRKAILQKKIDGMIARIDALKFNYAVAGDEVQFGHYQQGQGIAPIEWKVLERQGDRLLLLSKYGLKCKEYHVKWENITWENCTLRSWLNSQFIMDAFSDEERKMIVETDCDIPENPKSFANPGNATVDKVFLLSIDEAEKRFSSDEERICKLTAFTKTQGADAECWWLRSPGNDRNRAAGVYPNGSMCYIGNYVNNDKVCVRPALWINL